MGIFSRFRNTTTTAATPLSTADYYRAWELSNEAYTRIMGMTPAEIWRSQPYLRTVVTFLARNVAQLGLQVFQRVGETDRRRVRSGRLVRALSVPNEGKTGYELIFELVADMALYDTGYWLLGSDPQSLVRLPVSWVQHNGGGAVSPKSYLVKKDDKGQSVEIPGENILAFPGWHPASLQLGSSPVEALKAILAEQVQAAAYRKQVWERGGRVGSVLQRPAGAPEWSDAARTQFKKDWDSRFTGSGPDAGGTPLLEDGMTLGRVDFSAHEQQFVEAARLAFETVAQVFHVNPTMMGSTENTSYSNVREFRRMLYGDTLGPLLAQVEARINAFVVPRFDPRPGIYVEFNIAEKLQGSFEEQTQALQAAVGRPWMSANEARARLNLPSMTGEANQLVVPLNVLVGGQASPRDSASKDRPASGKAGATDVHRDKIAQVLGSFFARQSADVQIAIGNDGGDWWRERHWNAELAADLHKAAVEVTGIIGEAESARLGFSAAEYDRDRTLKFLQVVAENKSANINATTRDELEKTLAEDGEPEVVFEKARDWRAPADAVGLATFLAGFATHEAAQQLARVQGVTPKKTWVTGSDPRPTHAAMNGETVGWDEPFSNGMKWPGDSSDVDETANCNCVIRTDL